MPGDLEDGQRGGGRGSEGFVPTPSGRAFLVQSAGNWGISLHHFLFSEMGLRCKNEMLTVLKFSSFIGHD